jgi:hypothetical protein
MSLALRGSVSAHALSLLCCASALASDAASTAQTDSRFDAIESQLQALVELPLVLRGGFVASEVLAPRVIIDSSTCSTIPCFASASAWATRHHRKLFAPVGDDASLLMRQSSFSGRTITLRRCSKADSLNPIASDVAAANDDDDPDSWFSPAFFAGVTSFLGLGALSFADLELKVSESASNRDIICHRRALPVALQASSAAVFASEEAAHLSQLPASLKRDVHANIRGSESPPVVLEATGVGARNLRQHDVSAAATSALMSSRLPLLHATLLERRKVEHEAQSHTMQAVNSARCDVSWRPIYGRDLRDAVSLSSVAGFTACSRSVWHEIGAENNECAVRRPVTDSIADGATAALTGRLGTQVLFASLACDVPSSAAGASYRGGFVSATALARPCDVVQVS